MDGTVALMWAVTLIAALAALGVASLALVRLRRLAERLPPNVDEAPDRGLVEVLPADHPPRGATGGSGLVRFNAFDDTGGNQSFALALLDADADGFVLSSLHSRQATRLYVKRISAGSSELPLSQEEAQAVEQALRRPPRKR